MKPKHFFFATLLGALLLSPAMLAAHPEQDQGNVADAARKAQAGKKPPAKPATVFTNDNLDAIKGTISVVGQQEAPASAPNQAVASQDKSKPAATDDKTKAAAPPAGDKPPVQDEAYWRKAFADARRTLANDAKELDILQREYNLKQTQYYSDPNTAMKEQFNRADITDTKRKIDEKVSLVGQDTQAVTDLEDALRKAGGDPGWASAQ